MIARKPGFFVLLMAAMWLVSASACETLNGDPFKAAGDIDVGSEAACAIDVETSEIECWGQLGSPTNSLVVADYGAFATPVDPGVAYEAVAVGDSHACAVEDLGAGVRCWGANNWGQLGDGTTTNSPSPVDVVGLPNKQVVDLSAQRHTTCATFDTGLAYCWGSNFSGELGDGTTVNTSDKTPPHPAPVVGSNGLPLTGIGEVEVGDQGHACALKTDATVLCWGSNSAGQLGVGPLPGGADAVAVAQPLSLVNVESLFSGYVGSCAKIDSGPLYCWGAPIGLSNSAFPATDVPVIYSGFQTPPVQLAMGANRMCGLLGQGVVECVGDSTNGGLGDGSTGSGRVTTPVVVSGTDLNGFSGIYTNRLTTCARTIDVSPLVRCWGAGSEGQIGNGESLDSPTPALVVRPTN